MSLTEAEHVFGGIHEDALNDMIQAYFTARPRYRRYGSTAFVAATSVQATHMDPIPFPSVPGGIDWAVTFDTPVVDLHKQTRPLPPQIGGLAVGQLALHTTVAMCIVCAHRQDSPGDPVDHLPRDSDEHGPATHGTIGGRPTCFHLDVAGVGHLESWVDAAGQGAVRVRLDGVEIVDVTPDGLESFLECLLRMVLDAALSQLVLPIAALDVGAFQLQLQRGPEIEDDQIKVYGDL